MLVSVKVSNNHLPSHDWQLRRTLHTSPVPRLHHSWLASAKPCCISRPMQCTHRPVPGTQLADSTQLSHQRTIDAPNCWVSFVPDLQASADCCKKVWLFHTPISNLFTRFWRCAYDLFEGEKGKETFGLCSSPSLPLSRNNRVSLGVFEDLFAVLFSGCPEWLRFPTLLVHWVHLVFLPLSLHFLHKILY